MQTYSATIRGLINDLLRSLSAAMVHIDDLIIKLDKESSIYADVLLTHEQIQRSVEIFLELRSESTYFIDKLNSFNNNEYDKKFDYSTINQVKLKSNELLTAICRTYDLMLLDNDPKCLMDKVVIMINIVKNYLDINAI